MLKQVGALPYRRAEDGTLEVLLVTSRDTGRWIIPKGWPSKRLTDHAAAAREAREEAGVTGEIQTTPEGDYMYFKRSADSVRLVDVAVFLLAVRKERKRWREDKERRRAWFPAQTAAELVQEPALKTLIAKMAGEPVPPPEAQPASQG